MECDVRNRGDFIGYDKKLVRELSTEQSRSTKPPANRVNWEPRGHRVAAHGGFIQHFCLP